MSMSQLMIISVLAVLCGLFLQGCSVEVPKHYTGYWQSKTNYLSQYQYHWQGLDKSNADLTLIVAKETSVNLLNSCAQDSNISAALACGGNGRCASWNDFAFGDTVSSMSKGIAFCECSRYWADPECRTPKKSQVTAFLLSMFFGMFGVDQFYLGFDMLGFFKLFTLGGGGLWWFYDIVRIGSHPVMTFSSFKLAADLPHYAFVLATVSFMLIVGFTLALKNVQTHRNKKRHEFALLRMEDDSEKMEGPKTTYSDYVAPVIPPSSGNYTTYGATSVVMPPRPTVMTTIPVTRAVPVTSMPVMSFAAFQGFQPSPTLPAAAVQAQAGGHTLLRTGLAPTLPPIAPTTAAAGVYEEEEDEEV